MFGHRFGGKGVHGKVNTLVATLQAFFNNWKNTIKKFNEHVLTGFHKCMLCAQIIVLVFIPKNLNILQKLDSVHGI